MVVCSDYIQNMKLFAFTDWHTVLVFYFVLTVARISFLRFSRAFVCFQTMCSSSNVFHLYYSLFLCSSLTLLLLFSFLRSSLFLFLYIYPSIYLFVCLFVSDCLFACLSLCLFICLFSALPVTLSAK